MTTQMTTQMTAAKIYNHLLTNWEQPSYNPPITATEAKQRDKWSLADLFIRQWLNNGGDGFCMKNVEEMYNYLVENKDDVIKFDLVSKDGWNNSSFPLWGNFHFWEFSDLEKKMLEATEKWEKIFKPFILATAAAEEAETGKDPYNGNSKEKFINIVAAKFYGCWVYDKPDKQEFVDFEKRIRLSGFKN